METVFFSIFSEMFSYKAKINMHVPSKHVIYVERIVDNACSNFLSKHQNTIAIFSSFDLPYSILPPIAVD